MPDLSLDSTVGVPPDVIYRGVDQETVVLNLETGVYFGLDDVGARIWQLIVERGSLRAVRAALVDEFDVSAEALDRDLIAFVTELHAKGLIVPV